MGSSPSSHPGTNSQNCTTRPSSRVSNSLHPQQSDVFVAWGSQADFGEEETTLRELENNETMVCEACKANFNLIRRKNLCCDCKKHYCNSCSAKEHKRCRNCLLFKHPITRDSLKELKIKDLRQYLTVHNIPTEQCKEKGDLVELIYNFLNSRGTHGPTGLYQGSANISQNRSGSGFTQSRPPPPPNGPHTGFSNLQNTAERLYNQAHQQFFGGSATTTEGRPLGSITVTTNFGSNQTAQPHGPFAPSQEQYSSSATREHPTQHSYQESRSESLPAAGSSTYNSSPSGQPQQHSTVEEGNNQDEPLNQTNRDNTADEPCDPPPVKRRASLKDIATPEDISHLSIRQLKEILRANFVDYKGCVERYELSDRVKRLYEDREEIKAKEEKAASASNGDTSYQPAAEDDLCRICMDATIDCVLLECGHMVTCTTCGKQMNECPICRQYVIRCVHIFRS